MIWRIMPHIWADMQAKWADVAICVPFSSHLEKVRLKSSAKVVLIPNKKLIFVLKVRILRRKAGFYRATLRFALLAALPCALRAWVCSPSGTCLRCAPAYVRPCIQLRGRVSPSGRGGSGALCAGTCAEGCA